MLARMRRLLALLTFALTICACDNGSTKPPPDTEQHVFGACYRNYVATLNAWTDQVGRVPPECAELDRDYTIQITQEENIPCALEQGPSDHELWIGCTQPDELTIYLLDERTNAEKLDTSVHEWVHALAECVDGDMDLLHARAELWEGYEGLPVETLALTDLVIGQCANATTPAGPEDGRARSMDQRVDRAPARAAAPDRRSAANVSGAWPSLWLSQKAGRIRGKLARSPDGARRFARRGANHFYRGGTLYSTDSATA